MQRLGVMDGLRGVAILLVLWFHLWQVTWLGPEVHLWGGLSYSFSFLPETGFVGVDLFFFISGFCLFYPYARSLFDGRPRQTIGEFAWRRAIKIVPSYVLAIGVLIAVGGATGIASFWDGVRQVALHLAFIHTWFSDSYGSINGVLWSLGVEVQFYVLFPLLCWAAMRWPELAFAGMFGEAIVYRTIVAGDQFNIGSRINQLPAVLDLFAAGMLCAYLYRWIEVQRPLIAARRFAWTAAAITGLCAGTWLLQSLYATRFDPNWASNWYVWHRSLLALAFLALALGSLFAHPLWQRAVANPGLIFLSLVSYNLYLWHPAIARALRDRHIPSWASVDPHADPTWQLAYTLVAFVFAIAIAAALTYGFERPLLGWRPFGRAGGGSGESAPTQVASHEPPSPGEPFSVPAPEVAAE